jgi:hypothetical protein
MPTNTSLPVFQSDSALLTLKRALVLLVMSVGLFACSDENNTITPPPAKAPLVIPATFDSTGYSTNVATEAGVRTQLATLTSFMQRGRNMDSTVALANLRALYDGTTLKTVTGTGYQLKVDTALQELAAGSGTGARLNWQTAPTGVGQGGVIPTAMGGRVGFLYDENLLEMEQVVEKGLFTAAMYNHAVSLITTGNITESTIDKLVEIYGAKPLFANGEWSAANNPTATLRIQNRDRFSAQYAARRSDTTDANSLYARIRSHLITAKAAVRAGANYTAERDSALTLFRRDWEKALAATVINYCFSALQNINALPRTDATITAAMHAYGEGVGFTSGLRGVPASQRVITDAQIDEILDLLRARYFSTRTAQSYLFLSDVPTTAQLYRLDGRNDPNTGVIERLQQIYGFSATEVESFRRNFVADQRRN